MSQKTIKKEKGHRLDEVEYFIPFYSKEFFKPTKKKDEDKEDTEADTENTSEVQDEEEKDGQAQ